MSTYKVGGFSFLDEQSAMLAAKELKAVEKLIGQLKDADEQSVYKVYNQLLDKKIFSTEVGVYFLKQIRLNLIDSGYFVEKDIRPVYEATIKDAGEVTNNVETNLKTTTQKTKKTKEKVLGSEAVSKQIKHLKQINTLLLIVIACLLIIIGGMFYISTTINSPNILNYEEKLVDKYSEWEQQLTEREEALRQKENK